MGAIRSVFLFLLCGLLLACAQSPAPLAYPTGWYAPVPADSDNCAVPEGLFSNLGASSDPDFPAPKLASILFEEQLAGLPVESIRIRLSPDRQYLVFNGVLAGVMLEQQKYQKTIGLSAGDCEKSWQGESDSGVVGATMRTEALLYTGGVLMPLSQKYRYKLQLLQDGALLLHLQVREKILGAMILPLSFNEEYWLRYDAVDAAAALSSEQGPPELIQPEPITPES
ncbi:hypothetical protein G8764_02910 [Pseudomaricurvus alcaniphilus]|uniref:hypothetical protein n=1 Tax=Pseudomaricurvus alcaniphilus TaxID=1166482 RepID=UPI00140D1082|nr:hypothetical protein [Pseudomaricurvus alcaniphilus]NHN36239.1 hypothetical protein [Pseudomaricurvus alcaniphilus]